MSASKDKKKKKLKTSREQMIQEALTSRILKEGWLNKRGGSVKTWKRRYFVIREHKCYYYKEQLTQKMAMRGAQPMGQVDFSVISSCDDVTPADIKGEKKNVEYFKLTVKTGRGFYLIAAPSADLKREWMDAFREALRLYKQNEEMWQARADGTYDPFAETEKERQRLRSQTTTTRDDGSEEHRHSDGEGDGSAIDDDDDDDDDSASADRDDDDDELELPEELYAAGLTDESDLVARMRSEELYKAVQTPRYPAIKALTGLKTSVTWRNDKEGRKSAVHLAAELGDRTALQLLLGHVDAPLEQVLCARGWTALHYAAYGGSSKCARLLLHACPALLSVLDGQGRSASYVSIAAGHAKLASLLVGAELDGQSAWYPLHRHLLAGDVASVRQELILAQASPAAAAEPPPYGLTLLHLAACAGSVELVELLLGQQQQAADVNAVDQYARTAMHVAANAAHASVVQLLGRHGAAADALDARSKTPLHFAAGRGHRDTVAALLQLGADCSAPDEMLFTPLHTAAVHGCGDDVLELLAASLSLVNQPATCGYTPLFLAVHGGHAATAAGLLQRGATVDAVTLRKHSPLHEAASRGKSALVRLLLDAGANKNLLDSRGYTPVHHAVVGGRLDCLEALLQAGADANLTEGPAANSPLYLAIETNSEAMAAALLDAGARLDQLVRGTSPLHRAIDYGHSRLVRLLIDRQHPLDIVDEAGISPLVLALRQQSLESARYLLDAGADVNYPSQAPGWRPVLEAASHPDPDAVALVLARPGADANWAETTHQLTALHVAAAHGFTAVAAALLRADADVNAVDDAGNKPIHYAAQGEHHSLTLLLCSAASAQLSAEAAQLVAALFAQLKTEYHSTVAVEPPPAARLEALAVCRPSSTPESQLRAPTLPPPPLPAGGSAIAASSVEDVKPRRRETLSMQLSARTYIQYAQKMLSPQNYTFFQEMLRDYKSKKLSITELMHNVIDLFRSTYQPVLLRDFVFFIPERYKETYTSKVQLVIEEMNAQVRSSE